MTTVNPLAIVSPATVESQLRAASGCMCPFLRELCRRGREIRCRKESASHACLARGEARLAQLFPVMLSCGEEEETRDTRGVRGPQAQEGHECLQQLSKESKTR